MKNVVIHLDHFAENKKGQNKFLYFRKYKRGHAGKKYKSIANCIFLIIEYNILRQK